jgi:glutamate synthase (NADPH/NADH) large chain
VLFRSVDLDPMDDDDDVVWLRSAITTHFEMTGSAVAERILSDWWNEVEHFQKVFPKDFKRILEATRDAEERGVDVDDAIMAAARG